MKRIKVDGGVMKEGYYYEILETRTLVLTDCFIDLVEDSVDEVELAERRKDEKAIIS